MWISHKMVNGLSHFQQKCLEFELGGILIDLMIQFLFYFSSCEWQQMMNQVIIPRVLTSACLDSPDHSGRNSPSGWAGSPAHHQGAANNNNKVSSDPGASGGWHVTTIIVRSQQSSHFRPPWALSRAHRRRPEEALAPLTQSMRSEMNYGILHINHNPITGR